MAQRVVFVDVDSFNDGIFFKFDPMFFLGSEYGLVMMRLSVEKAS
jgi:hypothetical protein